MPNCLTLKKSNCKNCYKCIRHCPVKSIRFSGSQAHIIGNECILCGHCFVVCPQNAKEIVDETEKVKVLIQSGDPVVVSLAPSFVANYDGCHSINLLIQKYFPKVLPYLADVLSPMQAHCEDIRRRIPNAKTVFIGPCVAKKDEAEYYEGVVDAVLTYEELTGWMKKEGVELRQEKRPDEHSLARFFPTTGGILKTMAQDAPGYTYLALDGVENCIAALREIEQGNIHHCFIEMSACVGSCAGGPVMEKYGHSPLKDYLAVSRYAGDKDFNIEGRQGFQYRAAGNPPASQAL